MKRLPFRRGGVLVLALAVLATAMALWLGVFGQERAAADPGPVDLTVSIASDPISGETMAEGSVISYVVTVTSDDVTAAAGGDITLEIALENATFVGGTLQVSSGITCNTGVDPIDCDIPDFVGAGSKAVSFDATVGAAGPVLVGAAIDPPIDGLAAGEVDEGAAAPDFDDDEGDEPVLNCAAVGEGTDGGTAAEPDNFDCTSHAVANADLTITKTASPLETTAVAVGSVITYTLTASNDVGAAGTATNVVIRDYIGAGLTFESAAPASGVICTDTTPPIDCTVASLAPGESRTVVIVVTVSAASGAVLNGAYVDPNNVIGEDNEDADDPLACAAVGEGAAGAAEPDNYDCTKHDVVEEATPTPSPTPTVTRDFDLQLGWNNFVWTGADATAADTALNCIAGNFAIAYALDAGGWLRYVPGQPDITTLATVDKYDSLLVLVTASEVQCLGMPVEP